MSSTTSSSSSSSASAVANPNPSLPIKYRFTGRALSLIKHEWLSEIVRRVGGLSAHGHMKYSMKLCPWTRLLQLSTRRGPPARWCKDEDDPVRCSDCPAVLLDHEIAAISDTMQKLTIKRHESQPLHSSIVFDIDSSVADDQISNTSWSPVVQWITSAPSSFMAQLEEVRFDDYFHDPCHAAPIAPILAALRQSKAAVRRLDLPSGVAFIDALNELLAWVRDADACRIRDLHLPLVKRHMISQAIVDQIVQTKPSSLSRLDVYDEAFLAGPGFATDFQTLCNTSLSCVSINSDDSPNRLIEWLATTTTLQQLNAEEYVLHGATAVSNFLQALSRRESPLNELKISMNLTPEQREQFQEWYTQPNRHVQVRCSRESRHLAVYRIRWGPPGLRYNWRVLALCVAFARAMPSYMLDYRSSIIPLLNEIMKMLPSDYSADRRLPPVVHGFVSAWNIERPDGLFDAKYFKRASSSMMMMDVESSSSSSSSSSPPRHNPRPRRSSSKRVRRF